MNAKWTIGIGIFLLIAVIVSVFTTWYKVGMVPLPEPPVPASSPVNNIDRLLSEMEFETITFNTPKNINIHDSPQIRLILSLSGYMFQITAIKPETQAVSKNQCTEWKWEIDRLSNLIQKGGDIYVT